MKQDNRYFGQLLSKLNNKVNRRSSYIHNTTLKYHQGKFSHDLVISNLKPELYMQTSRHYISIESRNKESLGNSTVAQRQNFSIDEASLGLRTTLVKFYIKPLNTNKSIQLSRRAIMLNKLRKTRDANNNT